MIKIIKFALCLLTGYLLGSLSPAALLGRIKNIDLRKKGTGNLGATNVMLTVGRGFGALVMILDIAKAALSVKLSQLISPDIAFAPIAAGAMAVVGHIFPFYMKFKGGKGLAPYAGMVLAVDPRLFLFLLLFCTAAMFIANHSVAMPLFGAGLFPLLSFLRTDSIMYVIIASAVSVLITLKHLPNLKKAVKQEDIKIREYIKESFKI